MKKKSIIDLFTEERVVLNAEYSKPVLTREYMNFNEECEIKAYSINETYLDRDADRVINVWAVLLNTKTNTINSYTCEETTIF